MGKDQSASGLANSRDAILHYLRNSPYAADSLEGVMNWWLPQQEAVEAGTAEIEQALEQLIGEGLVKRYPWWTARSYISVGSQEVED